MAVRLRNLADVLDWCHDNGRNQTSESRVSREETICVSWLLDWTVTLLGMESQCNFIEKNPHISPAHCKLFPVQYRDHTLYARGFSWLVSGVGQRSERSISVRSAREKNLWYPGYREYECGL